MPAFAQGGDEDDDDENDNDDDRDDDRRRRRGQPTVSITTTKTTRSPKEAGCIGIIYGPRDCATTTTMTASAQVAEAITTTKTTAVNLIGNRLLRTHMSWRTPRQVINEHLPPCWLSSPVAGGLEPSWAPKSLQVGLQNRSKLASMLVQIVK